MSGKKFFKNGKLTPEGMQLLEEFNTLCLEYITLEHILAVKEISKCFEGQLDPEYSDKLLQLSIYFLENKQKRKDKNESFC